MDIKWNVIRPQPSTQFHLFSILPDFHYPQLGPNTYVSTNAIYDNIYDKTT